MRRLLLLVVVLAACDAPSDPPAPAATQTAVTTTSATLIARGATWYAWPYGHVDACWRDACFNPSGWLTGAGPLGYGETYLRTTLPYGSDPNHKVITTYFRKDFTIDDPAAVRSLRLDAMYDDGFVYYVNSFPIGRVSMPPPDDNVVPDQQLALGHEANNAYESFDLQEALRYLHPGTNTIAVEVHQVSPSSSDLVFDGSLVAELQPPPPPPPAPTRGGIPRGSIWSYWDHGGDLAPTWRYEDDVTNWQQGRGPLGYGETYLATTVGFGPDPSHKYTTTYFRKKFWIQDPAQVAGLVAELMFDDGVVIYLNNELLTSYSMPAGATTTSTAALDHEALNHYVAFDWTSFKNRLWPGENTIAVEVHQNGPASSDLVFDLALGVQTVPRVRVPRDSTWSYWDRGGDLGTAWRTASYDDRLWPSGDGPLGYGESYLSATTSYGGNASSKITTTYFRKKLRIDDPALVRRLDLELMYDDGAVIYVNGHEIARRAMPAGTITQATLSTGHEAENHYESLSWTVTPGVLVAGENELAVEVHQSSASSSDLVFDLGVQAKSDPIFVKAGNNPSVVPSHDYEGPTRWRYQNVEGPAVLHLPDGSWVMFYTGNDGAGAHQVSARAVSTNGVDWVQDDDYLDFVGQIVEDAVFDGTRFYLYTSSPWEPGIELSTSTDGLSWTSEGEVLAGAVTATMIFDAGVFKAWWWNYQGAFYSTSTDGKVWTSAGAVTGVVPDTVLRNGSGYIGWYRENLQDLGYATSPDGLVWTRHGISVSVGVAGTWDAGSAWAADAVRDGTRTLLYYTGDFSIGLATSP